MQTTIEQQNRRRETEYDRERAYHRFEEATDVAERMGYANDHELEHEIHGGKVYDAKGVRVADYTKNGLRIADELLRGSDRFEVEIRGVEHNNTLLVESVARGERPGNAVIEYGPCPDVIRDKKLGITVKGYREDLMRDMVRMHYIEGDKLKCRIFTLDNATALTRQRVGEFLNIPMPPGQPSIQALKNPYITILNAEQVDELVSMAKQIHDQALHEEKGGEWHAGSKLASKEDALSLVFKHSDLLDEHMAKWSRVVGIATSKDQINEMMEEQRKKTPAAIVKRERGEAVVSTNDRAVGQEVASGNYDGYCSSVGANQATSGSTLNKMGMNQGRVTTISKNCPICGASNITTIIDGDIISGKECGCWREICGTKVVRGTKLQNQSRTIVSQTSAPSQRQPRKISDEARAERIYGQGVRVVSEIMVGGSNKAVYSKDGELLGYI